MKNVMKKAHEITKKIIRKGDSYKATFRLALSFTHSLIKKGVEVVELKGTEKQIKWATDIKAEILNKVDILICKFEELIESKTLGMVNLEGIKLEKRIAYIEKRKALLEYLLQGKENIENISSASYLIDYRSNYRSFQDVGMQIIGKISYNENWENEKTMKMWNIMNKTISTCMK